jgi:hypothetical protein
MENLQTISNRCSVMIKDNVFSLVILPTENQKKVNWLFLWLLAWSASGVIVMANYFILTQDKAKLMLIVWLAFWAYFEFKIIKVFMWKRFGKENLWIKNGVLHYQQAISKRGKIKEFNLNLVSDFNMIELTKGSIADTFSQTFWVKGGERISFKSQATQVLFGMQLSDEETTKIISSIKQFEKKKS